MDFFIRTPKNYFNKNLWTVWTTTKNEENKQGKTNKNASEQKNSKEKQKQKRNNNLWTFSRIQNTLKKIFLLKFCWLLKQQTKKMEKSKEIKSQLYCVDKRIFQVLQRCSVSRSAIMRSKGNKSQFSEICKYNPEIGKNTNKKWYLQRHHRHILLLLHDEQKLIKMLSEFLKNYFPLAFNKSVAKIKNPSPKIRKVILYHNRCNYHRSKLVTRWRKTIQTQKGFHFDLKFKYRSLKSKFMIYSLFWNRWKKSKWVKTLGKIIRSTKTVFF